MPKLGVSQQGVSLRSLLPEAQFIGTDDIWVRSCCGKWDECRPGDVFVAVVDEENDGHQFAASALEAGAAALVTERWVISDRPQCVVPDSRRAYAQICHALAGHPSRHLSTIGVTGSHGKTSISFLLDSILSTAGQRVGGFHSLGATVSGRQLQPQEMVWTPPQIAFHLARFVLEDCSAAVLELPSRCLAQHQAEGLELDVAILTNIRRQHLDLHGSVENYRRVKSRIVDYLKPTGVAVVNADDPVCHALLGELEVPTLTYGVHQEANVQGRILETAWGEQTLLITAGDDSIVVRIAQLGKHSLDNCLAAAAAALAMGLTLPEIARGLEHCHVIPGRQQTVNCGQDFGVMVDAADNAEQLAVLLASGKYAPQGRTICVCSHGPDQSREQRFQMGRVAERGAQLVVVTAQQRQAGEIDYEPIHQILDGMQRPGRAQVIPDRIRAIEWALEQARPGDTVLIAGRGQQPIAHLDRDRWQLNDAEVCQAWLHQQNQQKMPTIIDTPAAADIFHIDDYR